MRSLLFCIFGVLAGNLAFAQEIDYKDNVVQTGRFVPRHPYSGSCKIVVPPDRILYLAFDDAAADSHFPYRISVSRSYQADGSDADKLFSFNNPACPEKEFNKAYPPAAPFIYRNKTGAAVVFILEFSDADEIRDAESQIWGPQKVEVTREDATRGYAITGTSVVHPRSKVAVTIHVLNPIEAQ
jgi:hypothetical protein